MNKKDLQDRKKHLKTLIPWLKKNKPKEKAKIKDYNTELKHINNRLKKK